MLVKMVLSSIVDQQLSLDDTGPGADDPDGCNCVELSDATRAGF